MHITFNILPYTLNHFYIIYNSKYNVSGIQTALYCIVWGRQEAGPYMFISSTNTVYFPFSFSLLKYDLGM